MGVAVGGWGTVVVVLVVCVAQTSSMTSSNICAWAELGVPTVNVPGCVVSVMVTAKVPNDEVEISNDALVDPAGIVRPAGGLYADWLRVPCQVRSTKMEADVSP